MINYKNWREPLNALTHLIGLIIIFPITLFLSYLGYKQGNNSYFLPLFIFCISISLLYLASTIYHMIPANKETILLLKKIDHMMIFVMIAGTYTPICMIKLNSTFGYVILSTVWIIAIFGIFLKLFWINAPRWLSTSIYVFMGWISILAIKPIFKTFPLIAIFLLLLGGIFYTIGAIIYATKTKKLCFKNFGFHETFHIYVILGSFCHILFMFLFVINQNLTN